MARIRFVVPLTMALILTPPVGAQSHTRDPEMLGGDSPQSHERWVNDSDSSPASALALSYTSLSFPGSTNTYASGINNLGWVVGQYDDSTGAGHGFIYRNGTYSSFDVPEALDTEREE